MKNLFEYNLNNVENSSPRHSLALPQVDPLRSLSQFPIYPYVLLLIWITCIVIIICYCVYCKCKHAEMTTSLRTSNFELQEVHVMNHPLPHVEGCVCLCCLQRQLTQELTQRDK